MEIGLAMLLLFGEWCSLAPSRLVRRGLIARVFCVCCWMAYAGRESYVGDIASRV